MTGDRPWLAQYDAGQPSDLVPEFGDMLALFQAAARHAPERAAVLYFDGRISFGELDWLSDRLAAVLVDAGFEAGDRLGLFLQNVPAFLIGMVAAWKAGGIPVPINPMNRARELALLLDDCKPLGLICHPHLFDEVVAELPPQTARPRLVLTAAARDFQTRNDARVLPGTETPATGVPDLLATLNASDAPVPATPRFEPDQPSMLVYTSGTTGVPKGVIITHGAVAFNAQVFRQWLSLPDGAPVLAMAPLFHVSGLVAHIAAAWMVAGPLILSYRFHPEVMLDAAEEHRPVFTMGAITALSALAHHPEARAEQLSSLVVVGSGGAPISPATVSAFTAKFHLGISNGYGLTETASPSHFQPLGQKARVDPASGAMSIGVPIFNTWAWIAAENGSPAGPREVGEIVLSGPQVSPGYWQKPEVTAEFMRPDGFRTGDVGFMDADGWFYIVDRTKDMINAGGYKVWPREVEDVLYSHPAVREAAVVGVPDAYRGETVKAAVSLKAGQSVTAQALIEWCKPRMAAYKYPRSLVILDDLPKTVTGKILRRMIDKS